MTFDLRFLPGVEEDVISGYSWYEDKARELDRLSEMIKPVFF